MFTHCQCSVKEAIINYKVCLFHKVKPLQLVLLMLGARCEVRTSGVSTSESDKAGRSFAGSECAVWKGDVIWHAPHFGPCSPPAIILE